MGEEGLRRTSAQRMPLTERTNSPKEAYTRLRAEAPFTFKGGDDRGKKHGSQFKLSTTWS